MSVSAIIVTRGDVDLNPIIDSLPVEWEKIVWNNGAQSVSRWDGPHASPQMFQVDSTQPDLSVYGRYAAIEYASHDLIFVADDDCIVSDPQEIVSMWKQAQVVASQRLLYAHGISEIGKGLHATANMPPRFRHDGYTDSYLVGFGACFHRDAPARAFARYFECDDWASGIEHQDLFQRTADVVFTTLTPRVLVDVPVEVLPYAHDDNRMWKQPTHVSERTQVLEMARKVRDGG